MREITITQNEQGQRLDRFLRKYLPQAPLSHIYRMIRRDVKLNQKRVHEDTMLLVGDVVQLYMTEQQEQEYRRETRKPGAKKQFTVAYEDENILIVDKPKGLLTHGDQIEKKNTLVNQVTGYLIGSGEYIPSREKTFVPAAVNRLDRNTSGLVIFGKNYGALQALTKMIRERRSIDKLYLAACFGEVRREMRIKSAMTKDRDKNQVRITGGLEDGRTMETIIRPVEVKKGFSLVEAELLTGRTHQIRVHLAENGFPIIGDPKYGDLRKNRALAGTHAHMVDSQFLHAYKLRFGTCDVPFEYLNGREFKSELPPKLQMCWEQL